ncbi:MAG: 2'-5' RNA ligase family protein [Bacteroidota bacterium]|jgi:2'-5' RNA ligase
MENRYFIAVIPPENIYNQIVSIKKDISLKYNSYAALKSPPHVTLHMPFNLANHKEKKFLHAIETWKLNITPIEIELKNYSSFEPRVIFINVNKSNSLCNLQDTVIDFMKREFNIFNQAEDLRGFHPHITIAFRDLKKNNFYAAMKEYSDAKYESNFLCNSIHVLKRFDAEWISIKEIKFC